MQIVKSIADFLELRKNIRGSIGFVPTMGFLHEGHLSLVRQALKENDFAAVSIFVNPTQFGPNEDFKRYPRDIKRDLNLLNKVSDAIMLFVPPEEDIYHANFNTWIEVGEISHRLEGKSRPGHFRGVCTVVAKLFNIVQPAKAYFGQKDAQQVLIIQKMVADLNMPLEIVVSPTVREIDGLAMSSRNAYLNPEERKAAPVLYKSLRLALDMWHHGEKNAVIIRERMISTISKEALASIDYVSVADTQTLEELDVIKKQALVSLAVKIGKTRLIDNMLLQ